MHNSYSNHIAGLLDRYQREFEKLRLQGSPVSAVLIHSGSDNFYYGDDQTVPFRAYGHFCHWLPINQPDQMLLITPGERPTYFQVIPSDHWYDQSIQNASWWCDEFEVVTLTESQQVNAYLKHQRDLAFLGENTDFAAAAGFNNKQINPPRLLHSLDYYRAYKSGYEIEQLKSANRQALIGHSSAKNCFENGGGEYDIHMAYLLECNIIEQHSPYTNIVALNEKSAILHYQHKRHNADHNAKDKSQVLLIDAGCRVNNYCSDITRTSVRPHTHDVFRSLLEEMEKLQLNLVDQVSPGLDYVKFHRSALELLNQVLIDGDIINCPSQQSLELGLASLFMPHGIGHLLGIQVHDAGGHLADPNGGTRPPPSTFPYLRNTRIMEENMVFTVEPGLYFIPVILDRERDSAIGKYLNWKLIDELVPLGGIRVEDNVQVKTTGVENLTRQ